MLRITGLGKPSSDPSSDQRDNSLSMLRIAFGRVIIGEVIALVSPT
jgi:hypothetical protein